MLLNMTVLRWILDRHTEIMHSDTHPFLLHNQTQGITKFFTLVPSATLDAKHQLGAPQLGYKGNPTTTNSASPPRVSCTRHDQYLWTGRGAKGRPATYQHILRLSIIRGSWAPHLKRIARRARLRRPISGTSPEQRDLRSQILHQLTLRSQFHIVLVQRIWWNTIIWSILLSSPTNLVSSLAFNLESIFLTVSMVLFKRSTKDDSTPRTDSTSVEEEPDENVTAMLLKPIPRNKLELEPKGYLSFCGNFSIRLTIFEIEILDVQDHHSKACLSWSHKARTKNSIVLSQLQLPRDDWTCLQKELRKTVSIVPGSARKW